jgi:ADP-heptose:LPS heptosyltransferase
MHKYYIYRGGGIGDLVDHYYIAREWRALESIKRDIPNIVVKLITYSANSAAAELHRYNPWLDEWQHFDIYHNHRGQDRLSEFTQGYAPLANSNIVKRYNRDALPLPNIYLNEQEQLLVNALTQRPYICINPFAGLAERLTLDHAHWRQLIDRIIDELAIPVILLGGSWTLINIQSTQNSRLETPMLEQFQYERAGLTNLVNQVSIRVAVSLSIQCDAYIGNYTGTTHPSWIYQIKTYTCVSKAVGRMGPHDLAPYTWDSWPLMFSLPFSRMAILDETASSDEIVNDIIHWLKT